MKELLAVAGVPTARHAVFGAGDEDAAFAFLETLPGGIYVVKTDGLAAGKGVVVTDSLATRATPCATTSRAPRSATPGARS